MARVSRYSSSERQVAVARAFSTEASPTDVARELGIHTATLYRWAAEEPTATKQTPTRRRLVDATQVLLREQDYNHITVEEVARESGVALRTAFHHFATKRDLFQAAIDEAANALVAEMDRRAQQLQVPQDALEQVRMYLRVSAEAVHALPQAHVLFRDLGVPPADGFALRWHERFEQTLAQLLDAAAQAGSLRQDIEPCATAKILSRSMRGIHAAVFDGADSAQALALVDRLHTTVAAF